MLSTNIFFYSNKKNPFIFKKMKNLFFVFLLSGSKWSYFLGTDLLEQFLKYLSQGHLTAALTIWKRHQVTTVCLRDEIN